VTKLTLAIDRSAAVARASAAANDTLAASNAKVAESAGVTAGAVATTRDATLVTDAAIIKSTKAKTVAVEDAAKAQNAALNSVANNPIVKKGALVLGVGLFAGVYEALKSANQVQAKLTLLSTAAGAATKDLPYFMKGALTISNQYGTSLGSVLDVMYRIKSASVGMNLSNAQVLSNSKAAVELGVLQGGTMTPSQLDNTARVYGAFENAGLRGAQTPSQISATVNAAVGAGDVRMNDVIGMIGKGGIQAAQASHMSAADMLGWMDTMTHFGANPQNAGTLVAHAINLLQSGSKMSQEATQMGGIAPGQLAAEIADPKVGLIGAMTTLKNSFHKFNPTDSFPHTASETPKQAAEKLLKSWGIMTNQEYQAYTTGGYLTPQQQQQIQNAMTAKAFGSARQMTPEQTLLMNMMKAQGIITQINQKATPEQYKKDLALAQETPLNQLKIAGNKWKNVLIEIGTALQGPAKIIAHGFSDFAGWLQENMVEVEVALGAVAALGAAFIALRVANSVMNLIGSLGKLREGFGLLGGRLSGVLNTLSGGRFGTAYEATQVPTTEFAGAVNEFSAAVTRFMGESGILGSVGGAGAAERAGVAAAAGAETAAAGAETAAAAAAGASAAYAIAATASAVAVAGAAAYLGAKYLPGNTSLLDRVTGTHATINGHPVVTPAQLAAQQAVSNGQPVPLGSNGMPIPPSTSTAAAAAAYASAYARRNNAGAAGAVDWATVARTANPGAPVLVPSAASTVTSATGQVAKLLKQAAADQVTANAERYAGLGNQANQSQAAEAALAERASTLLASQHPTTIYTQINLDGKKIADVVQAQIKKTAARN
jgi:hypothetical protein